MNLPGKQFVLDLGERINPVLLKEIRQGVRSKFYTIVFLAIQVIMIFYLVFGLAMSQGSGDSGEMDVFFWGIVGVFLLGILPLMGTNALATETRESRLDMLVLSRLSARRITYGKWMAIIGQGVLLVTALLPYLVLRYYMGSVEFLDSLLVALILLLFSAILTGVAVGLSVINSVILRWIILLIAGFWGVPALLATFFAPFRSSWNLAEQIPVLLITGGLVVALVMEFSAARFSPVRENHDSPKRLILAVFLAAFFALEYFDFDADPALAALIFSFIFIAWDALCRPASSSPPVYEPFVRLGFIGRLLGRFLYPGWASSLLFNTLIIVIFIVGLAISGEVLDNEEMAFLLIIIGAFSVPFAVILYTPLSKMPYGRLMFLAQLLLGLLMVLLFLIEDMTGAPLHYAACWIPTCLIFLEMMDNVLGTYEPNRFFYLVASGTTTVISLILILIKAVPQFKAISKMEKQAKANLAARKKQAESTIPSVPPQLPEEF